MTITYQGEQLSTLWSEIMPIIERHWEEVATFHDIPLDCDRPRYKQAEDAGVLRTYTARKNGLVVAYAVFIVAGHMHYASCRTAVQDAIYVSPEQRGVGLGTAFVRYTEKELGAEGVDVVHHHQKIAHPALGSLLKHEGYEHAENLWVKRLERAHKE